jgi:F0F1-type ATP synthase alpha subunit
VVVYDDLSKQARKCHYYYVVHLVVKHSLETFSTPRLLERAAKLSDALGSGSMTAYQLLKHKKTYLRISQQMLFQLPMGISYLGIF